MPICPETISTLFGEVSDLPYRERERYYDLHGVPDDLRDEVESLLSYDIGRPIGDVVQTAVGVAFQEPVSDGDSCGPFQLLRQIGRGGMGVVYLAERVDGEVRQTVAVKLLRAALDSGAARQRFRQERQILANLAHPNIARMIDAGHRADGHPYLVMEYVEGHPIDEHSRGLTPREKVALIATVCEAIASAHRALVVHRDLKPGNILVDANGEPRVLDFGIAKLMDESAETATVERRLTPDYASPEQVAGLPVTTATDIYSLGAVLYKLLTGETPARLAPAPPSRVCPGVDRDLDAIVLKTLRVEPEERYPTADKLAEDLRAWIDGRPVSARHGERWYRARRQLRRHWALAAAVGVAATGLVGGLLAARAQRDVAQQRFDEVRKLANEFFALEKEIHNLAGSTPARERIVKTSIQYLEGLTRSAAGDWRLKQEIAAGYRKAAEAQGISGSMNLGRPADAQESLRKAAVLLKEARQDAPGDRGLLRDSIELVNLQARAEYVSKNLEALAQRFGELQGLLDRYEATAKDEPAEWLFLGKIYEWMAVSGKDLPSLALPMRFARRSVELRKKAAGRDPSFQARGSLGNAWTSYAGLLRATGDLAGAVDAYREGKAVLEQLVAEKPGHHASQVNLATTLTTLARSLGDPSGPSLRQTDAAVQHYEESLRISRKLMAVDPTDTQIRFNAAVTAWRLGDARRIRGPREAIAAYDEAIGILRPMPGRKFTRDVPLAAALAESAIALDTLGRRAEARDRWQEAAALCATYREQKVPYETCSEYSSRADAALALTLGRPADAVAAHRRWLELGDNGKETKPKEDLFSSYVLAKRYRLLRESLVAAGMPAEAEAFESKRQAIVEQWKGKLSGRNDAELFLSM
jgi:tRNA A-37 threonylcarbamoyl transferase component Bud32/tetratricopeptide (TPR) repeat protein